MKKMSAWVLEQPKQLSLKKVAIPLCSHDDVLIRIISMSICNGSDPSLYLGNNAYQTPYIFGHEAVGVIEQVGMNVHDFKYGQRVVWWCTIGAFAQYIVVNPNKVSMFVVPNNIPNDQAAMLELVIAASRTLMPFMKEAKGKSLRILGLGPSGLVSVMFAKTLGFTYIEGWDLRKDRCALALQFGANRTDDPSRNDFDATVLRKVDISLDMIADDLVGDSLTQLCICAKNDSTVVSYGHPIHGRRFSPHVFQSASLTMRSPVNDHAVIREKGKRVMALVESGAIQLDPLVSEVHPFSQLGSYFAEMLEHPWDKLKMIFTFEEGKPC